MKNHIRSIIYGIALAGFTVYILMDTFVISRVYSSIPSNKGTADKSVVSKTESTAVTTDNSYSDGNISIAVTEQ